MVAKENIILDSQGQLLFLWLKNDDGSIGPREINHREMRGDGVTAEGVQFSVRYRTHGQFNIVIASDGSKVWNLEDGRCAYRSQEDLIDAPKVPSIGFFNQLVQRHYWSYLAGMHGQQDTPADQRVNWATTGFRDSCL